MAKNKEYVNGVLMFDSDCEDCNHSRHRCPGCGDNQRHNEKSIYDGHTPSDCLENRKKKVNGV